jgi:hypothetical protein
MFRELTTWDCPILPWQLQQFFQQVKQDGRHVTVRILHEANGNW